MTPEQIATAWNAWWSSVSTGANDKHMQTAFEAGYLAALKAQQPGEDVVERVAIRDITGERERQITDEHWSPEHDDKHSGGEMAMAAACYAYGEIIDTQTGYCLWPWFEDWWKPADTRRNLVKAGALIVAEIERLDRAAIAAIAKARGQ